MRPLSIRELPSPDREGTGGLSTGSVSVCSVGKCDTLGEEIEY